MKISASSATNGGTITVRLGGPQGKILGNIEIAGTSGWDTFQIFSARLGDLEGPHDLYLEFSGPDGFLFNLDWFDFDTLPVIDPTVRPAVGVRFHTEQGRTYLIRKTPDLAQWWSADPLVEGTATPIERFYPMTADRAFFSIRSN